MFLRNDTVKEPTGSKYIIPYCRDCNSYDVEIIHTCKSCGSNNIATPLIHNLDDYQNNIGTKQEFKDVTRHIYQCDICGNEFDGLKVDGYMSYADGSFESSNYAGFADADTTDYTNYQLNKDLCLDCKKKLQTYLSLKLIGFTSSSNVNKLIDEYIENHLDKE